MKIQRGQRDKLEKYLNVNEGFEVVMNVSGPSVYDFTCFSLDSNEKFVDDKYMVFYNQTESPNGEIVYKGEEKGAVFSVNLGLIPEEIQKLSFAITIDGEGNMGMMQSHMLEIKQNNQTVLEFELNGVEFTEETAIVTMELYKKDVWRFSMIASGFEYSKPLEELLCYYGGEAIEQKEQIPQEKSEELQEKLEELSEVVKAQQLQTPIIIAGVAENTESDSDENTENDFGVALTYSMQRRENVVSLSVMIPDDFEYLSNNHIPNNHEFLKDYLLVIAPKNYEAGLIKYKDAPLGINLRRPVDIKINIKQLENDYFVIKKIMSNNLGNREIKYVKDSEQIIVGYGKGNECDADEQMYWVSYFVTVLTGSLQYIFNLYFNHDRKIVVDYKKVVEEFCEGIEAVSED